MPENQIGKEHKSGSRRTEECKKRQRIRTRSSYLLFRQLYDFLKNKPSVVDILRKFYDVLDAKRGFVGANLMSCWSLCSCAGLRIWFCPEKHKGVELDIKDVITFSKERN